MWQRTNAKPEPCAPAPHDAVVTVDLSSHEPRTPLGVLLAPALIPTASSPSSSTVTIVAGWEHLPSGSKLGPIQRSGLVRLGDRLVRINNVDITEMTFRDVMDLLRNMIHGSSAAGDEGVAGSVGGGTVRLRNMSFAPVSAQTGRDASSNGGAQRGNVDSPSAHGLHPSSQKPYIFRSSIRRARVRKKDCEGEGGKNDDDLSENDPANHTGEEGGVTSKVDEAKAPANSETVVEYEVACNLLIRFGGAGPSFRIGGTGERRSWSVWKRYSDFKALDEKLRESFGWQIDALNDGRGLTFPPTHVWTTFFGGTLNPAFIEQRRGELEEYWQSIQQIDAILDFADPSSHRYSRDLASFVTIEKYLNVARNICVFGRSSSQDYALPSNAKEQDDDSSLSTSRAPSYDSHTEEQKTGHSSQLSCQRKKMVDAVPRPAISPSTVQKQTATRSKRKKRAKGAAKPAFQRQYLS